MKNYLNYLVINKKDFIFDIGDKFKFIGLDHDPSLYYYPISVGNQIKTRSNSDLMWQRGKSIQVPKKYVDLITKKSENIKPNSDGEYEVVDVVKDFKIPTTDDKLYYLGLTNDNEFILEEETIKSNTPKQITLVKNLNYRSRWLKSDLNKLFGKSTFSTSLIPYKSQYGIYFTIFEKYDEYKDLLFKRKTDELNNKLKQYSKEFESFSKNIKKEGFNIDDQLESISNAVGKYLEDNKIK